MPDPAPSGGIEREFPLRCVLKVIAADVDGLEQEINALLRRRKHEARAMAGNRSAGGRYLTYNVDILFVSVHIMRDTLNDLRTLPGVKMVL